MVGKINIIISHKVVDFLDDLSKVLYKKEYFGFIESADEYVLKIYDDIDKNIFLNFHKKSPQKLLYLGKYYIFYNSNKRTTWYVFFEKSANNYLITGILNNHCEEANGMEL